MLVFFHINLDHHYDLADYEVDCHQKFQFISLSHGSDIAFGQLQLLHLRLFLDRHPIPRPTASDFAMVLPVAQESI
jgi:hypothetical protein